MTSIASSATIWIWRQKNKKIQASLKRKRAMPLAAISETKPW